MTKAMAGVVGNQAMGKRVLFMVEKLGMARKVLFMAKDLVMINGLIRVTDQT
jgi:hypothetical protein